MTRHRVCRERLSAHPDDRDCHAAADSPLSMSGYDDRKSAAIVRRGTGSR